MTFEVATELTKTQIYAAIAGSAVIGALVSSIIGELGRWRERKSRRHELLLDKAVALSISWSRTQFDIAKESNRSWVIPNQVRLTELYFKCLTGIIDTGSIPFNLKDHLDK